MKQMSIRNVALAGLAVIGVIFLAGKFCDPALKGGMSWSGGFYDEHGQLLRVTLSKDDKYRVWTRLDQYDPKFVEAVLAKEDGYFRYHWGVNPIALARAAWTTYGAHLRRVGGSTLTMQLARLRYGIKSKNIFGKIKQIAAALWIETFCGKKEILETYLNLLPYGSNVEGAGTASLVYFHKPPSKLTLTEALTLAVVPQSPTSRSLEKGEESARLIQDRQLLFAKLLKMHPDYKTEAFEMNTPIEMASIGHLPFLAPHFVNEMAEKENPSGFVTTTLNLQIQKMIENKIKNYVASKKSAGIDNAAALIVNWRTMEVKAAVGSTDFFDDTIQGQVNVIESKRSPGSALKPFVYALGLDQGLIHPLSLLKDAPLSFGGFDPENFDRDFAGPINATDALIKSRNVPAVALASKLKSPDFYEFLKSAAVAKMQDEKFYGLGTVLGGVEVTMEELTKMYAMLANGGILKDLVTIKNGGAKSKESKEADAPRLLSEEASFMVLDILRQNPRPGQNFAGDMASSTVPVFWKTGTSQGFRDAWSVGIIGHFVVAVWLGNSDGASNPALVGRELAGPLFFEITDGLKNMLGPQPPWMPKPSMNLTQVDVCALSGALPGPHCKRLRKTWFIPGHSPIQTCQIHREVLVGKTSGLRLCPEIHEPASSQVAEFWPSDLMKIFSEAGIPRRIPPAWDPRCPRQDLASSGLAPQITSPRKDIVYYLRTGAEGFTRISLAAITDGDVRETFWFVNEAFVGKSKGTQSFLWPAKLGSFVVRAIDDHGRSDSRRITVKLTE